MSKQENLKTHPASIKVVNMSLKNLLFFFEIFLKTIFEDPSFSKNRRRRFKSTSFTDVQKVDLLNVIVIKQDQFETGFKIGVKTGLEMGNCFYGCK